MHPSTVEELLRTIVTSELLRRYKAYTTILYNYDGEKKCPHASTNRFAARVIRTNINSEDQDSTAEIMQHFIGNLNLLRTKDVFKHHIAPFINFESDSHIFILSPWSEHGNIIQYAANATTSLRTLASLVRQMASGLAYLHEKNIVHGNFFPGNVIVVDCDTVVITDVGFYAIEAAIASGSVPLRCSSPYKPPEENSYEGMQGFFEPSKSSDTYSFAACTYAIYTRQALIHVNPRIAMVKIATSEGLLELLKKPDTIAPNAWLCLQKCWRLDPNARPTMEDILVCL